jgi:hypothetical protein
MNYDFIEILHGDGQTLNELSAERRRSARQIHRANQTNLYNLSNRRTSPRCANGFPKAANSRRPL